MNPEELKNKITPEQWEMHHLIVAHDVAGIKEFLKKHPSPAVTAEQLEDDQFLSDLMHVYKALIPYYDGHEASLKYCLEKGLVQTPKQEAESTEGA
jgi:hypothetical protein